MSQHSPGRAPTSYLVCEATALYDLIVNWLRTTLTYLCV